MSDLKKENLSKLDLIQLKEILHRQNILLKNSKLVEKLPDNGESVKKFRDKVEKEIQYRHDLQNIEKATNTISLNEKEKHIQKLCEIEKTPDKERYKPFSTLNTIKEIQPNSNIFKIMEDCAHCNKPTKLILLPESIDILQKQDDRVKEEQVRVRHQRILERLKEYEEDEETDSETDSSDNNLDLEDESKD